jgi:hypothetical protein
MVNSQRACGGPLESPSLARAAGSGGRRTSERSVHVVARHLTHRSAAGRATDETPRRRAQSPSLRAKPIVGPTGHSRTTSAGRSRVMSRTSGSNEWPERLHTCFRCDCDSRAAQWAPQGQCVLRWASALVGRARRQLGRPWLSGCGGVSAPPESESRARRCR